MKALCENITRYILPSVRSLIVTYLYKEKGLSQLEIANLLGISQSTVSRYINKERGLYAKKLMEIPSFQEKLSEIANKIIKGEIDSDSVLCELCLYLKEQGYLSRLVGH